MINSPVGEITFSPSGTFKADAAYSTYPNLDTPLDPSLDFREFVVSIGILNATTNHTTTDLKQKKVNFKLTLAHYTRPEISTWYATVEKFQFVEGLSYTFEVKNTGGTDVSISEVRMGDGAIDFDILDNPGAQYFYHNLEGTKKLAV